MVAAICILGVFIYFFFWSRRVRKNQLLEWQEFGQVEEKDELQGVITKSFQQKKRLYHEYWVIEIEAYLYNERQAIQTKVIWRKPFTDHLEIPACAKLEFIHAFGQRKDGVFYANRIESLRK